tara:strand:- start:555 stop:839 length:285 start_codon:yes stop_codon:yes gene_type:complete
MNTIILSYGEKFEKTKKSDKPILNNKNEIVNNIPIRSAMTRNRDKIEDEKYINFIKNRSLLAQTVQNPFLTKKFIEVIDDQEKYLIPKDSFNEK